VQLAVVPPFEPVQLQFQGPVPATVDAVPVEQRLVVGVELTVVPLEAPQAPLASSGAEHEALVPPLEPVQLHAHGPEPDTLDAVPTAQRLVDGFVVTPTLLAVPQAPLVSSGAEHAALVPPLDPVQAQDQGPEPNTLDAVPVEQRFVAGAVVTAVLLAVPQAPLVSSGAAHEALVPPLEPVQLQDQGPEPDTLDAVPVEQRLVMGTVVTAVLLAVPQAPLVSSGAAHEALVPPLEPVQVHAHGPEPDKLEAVPVEQRLVVGTVVTATLLAAPQAPLVSSGAEHEALVPPLDPVQVHAHGPEPDKLEAVPVEQRLVDGFVVTPTLLAAPQAPLVVGMRGSPLTAIQVLPFHDHQLFAAFSW